MAGMIHWRRNNLTGPFFTQLGDKCFHTKGNYYGVGGPGSGPRAIRGVVAPDGGSVNLVFTQCIEGSGMCANPYGMSITVNGGAVTITSAAIGGLGENHNLVKVFLTPAIEAGDDVVWSYDDSGGCIVDCDEGESIGDQGPLTIQNDLVLAGAFILLETGGKDVVLLEEDDGVGEDDGLQTEDAT